MSKSGFPSEGESGDLCRRGLDRPLLLPFTTSLNRTRGCPLSFKRFQTRRLSSRVFLPHDQGSPTTRLIDFFHSGVWPVHSFGGRVPDGSRFSVQVERRLLDDEDLWVVPIPSVSVQVCRVQTPSPFSSVVCSLLQYILRPKHDPSLSRLLPPIPRGPTPECPPLQGPRPPSVADSSGLIAVRGHRPQSPSSSRSQRGDTSTQLLLPLTERPTPLPVSLPFIYKTNRDGNQQK